MLLVYNQLTICIDMFMYHIMYYIMLKWCNNFKKYCLAWPMKQNVMNVHGQLYLIIYLIWTVFFLLKPSGYYLIRV